MVKSVRALAGTVLMALAFTAVSACGDSAESDQPVKTEASVQNTGINWAKVESDYSGDFGQDCKDGPAPRTCITFLRSNTESLLAAVQGAPAGKDKGEVVSAANELIERLDTWDDKFCDYSPDSPDCQLELVHIDIQSQILGLSLSTAAS